MTAPCVGGFIGRPQGITALNLDVGARRAAVSGVRGATWKTTPNKWAPLVSDTEKRRRRAGALWCWAERRRERPKIRKKVYDFRISIF